MKNKRFSLALGILFIMLSLIGCGHNKPLDLEKTVTLNMWHNYGGDMQETMDYLIDKFNATVGKENGIVINVTAISSSSELNKNLSMIINNDPGAPDMPDIFTGYPKVAIQFIEKDMLANLDDYFTEEELDDYVEEFIEEGRLGDHGLYVFPIAKSTEVLYVNQTLFDRFSAETGASMDDFSTFEGISRLCELYYEYSGGKQFYTADSWFNFAEIGMEQLNDSIFDGEILSLDGENYAYIFDTVYQSVINGGIAVYDGYSSDLSKTGEIVCSTGSSAGILFYGDTITYADGTMEEVEYNVLPYPTFENGEKIALQRGGGLMVAKNDENKEYAASIFIKWLTDDEQNLAFVANTGYLPVTKQAFEEDIYTQLNTLENPRISKLLTSVLSMYKEYTFFSAPTYSDFDSQSSSYEKDFKAFMLDKQENSLEHTSASSADALQEFLNR